MINQSSKIATFILLFIAACSSTPDTIVEVPLGERVKLDTQTGSILKDALNQKLRIVKSKTVSEFTAKLADRLSSKKKILSSFSNNVKIFRETKGKWLSYSFAGSDFFLPLGWVKEMEFENELAALIALEIANILNRHIPRKIESANLDIKAIKGGDEIRNFLKLEVNELGASIKSAVSILYGAGYDSRGLVSVWRILQKNKKRSPYSMDELESLINKSYREISNFAPIRNPIVKSPEFMIFLKKVRTL